MISYIPILKTTDAEIRAIENLTNDVKNKITPLFEIAKSRLSKNNKEGDVWRRMDRLLESCGDRKVILDITTEPFLQNSQIRSFKTSKNNYQQWCDFVLRVKKDYFSHVIPVLIINNEESSTEQELYSRLNEQIKIFNDNFEYITYRFSINDQHALRDLDEIGKVIDLKKIICIIDASFIHQGKAEVNAKKCVEIISNLNKTPVKNIAVAATSFPLNPTEYGDMFNLEEFILYKKVKTDNRETIYSDYGSLHNRRSTRSGGNGWIPRIDIPTQNIIFYHRQNREINEDETREEYFDVYVKVAEEVVRDERYIDVKKILKNEGCWGIEQIELAAKGEPQGLHPAFWISVRANIHMTLKAFLA